MAAQQEANRMPANSAQQTELQATAERLRANTVAQEHYGLFEHLHSPGQPAPAGWQEVGNSQASLNQAKLSPSRLTSKQSDFRAGMYTPDRGVLGGDFSPTLKSTGFPEATKGWLNGAQQANRFQPDAYDRHVQLTSKMRVASPSQVAGGAGVTPLTNGLSATAVEREKTPVVHSVLGADFSNLAGSDMPTDPTASALAGDSSANSPCFEDGVVEVSQSTSTAGLSARSRPGAERIQEIDQQLERDGEALSESERQALEEERQAIFTLRRSRNEALETACHYWAGSREACQFERSLLYYEFLTWGDLDNSDRDIFHYYHHTATQWGNGERDRITSIARQALSDIVIDTVTAPVVIGVVAGQALMGDEESQAILHEMGDEVKAFFTTTPAAHLAHISESNREQLAHADALEQAGQRDEADLVRMRVVLENQTMVFGAGGVAASLPKFVRKVVGRQTTRLLQTRSAEAVNETMIAAGNKPAWLKGTQVNTEIVPSGTRYQMVVNAGQAQALMEGKPAFGGFATPENIPSQEFARDKLVILEEFKPDVSYAITVETTAAQKLNSGFTGPLGNYSGGVRQVEFLDQRSLKMIGNPKLLPLE
ncbi:hypothetical protein ACU6TU_13475 [Halomonas sp. LS-001]